ncbi:MAG: hypothetical protein M1814_000887 [Vezdaea aestivalis]|nr:MAG: hypothetical protein M1814_000887 [Vezdaea aestivalis]
MPANGSKSQSSKSGKKVSTDPSWSAKDNDIDGVEWTVQMYDYLSAALHNFQVRANHNEISCEDKASSIVEYMKKSVQNINFTVDMCEKAEIQMKFNNMGDDGMRLYTDKELKELGVPKLDWDKEFDGE